MFHKTSQPTLETIKRFTRRIKLDTIDVYELQSILQIILNHTAKDENEKETRYREIND